MSCLFQATNDPDWWEKNKYRFIVGNSLYSYLEKDAIFLRRIINE